MTNTNNPIVSSFLCSVIGAGAILVLVASTAAQAAEWRIEPVLRLAAEFDDNADLTIVTVEEQDISGYVIDASARFAYSSPVTSFFVTPQLKFRDYGEPDFDSDDTFLRFSFDRKFKSSNFRFSGTYGDELARTGERADAGDLNVDDLEEIPDDDSGRVFVRGRRERLQLTPRYTFKLSNVSSLGAGIKYVDTTYEEGLQGLLNDSTDTRADITYRRAWSDRHTAIVQGTYRTFDSECPTCLDSVTGYGLNFGFENRLSETTIFRLTIGAENTELESGEDSVNPIANMSLTRRLETITLFAQYQRVISGGGGGSLAARDIINLRFQRQLNDRIGAGIFVRAYSTTAIEEGPVNIDERDYVQLGAQFIWNWTETFSVEVNYRYTIIDRERIGESANSNNVMLWLNWRPTPFVRSR